MFKNYKVIKEQELKDIASHGTLLVHEKSGARVVLIENDDVNKTFCIGFRTPPRDDTGVPHIIEHSVLCGSKKYPVKEPFVELMKSSLNTFLNAMTFADKTIYPVASCNDKDFENLMDVYLDAVLYPNILTNEKIFKQEGWHYELIDKDGEITYNGVVYNEMKGAFSSPDSILGRASGNSLFPDTPYGFESGGDPSAIPTLTYQNFVNFYKKYYHPSNSYIFLYGNFDKEERLEYLDREYLSKFNKIDPESELSEQKPLKKLIEKELLYPVTKEQGTENKTYMSYNIAFPKGTSLVDSNGVAALVYAILGSNGAPLEKALLKEKLGDVITYNYDNETLQPVLSINTKNANPDQKDKFVEVIEKELKKYAKEGVDKKAIEAAININEFKAREADYGGMSKGVIYAITVLGTWLYDDENPFEALETGKLYSALREKINTDYYEKLLEKYLINNTHKSVIVVKPSTTYQEEKENKVKSELKKFKDSLSDKEIEKIIADTKELKEYQASEDSKENLATIPLLKKEDLSYEISEIKNDEEEIDGIKVVRHELNANGISYINLLFDAMNIGTKNLPYIGLYRSLLGNINTSKHTYESLEIDENINTGGIGYSYYAPTSKEGDKFFFNASASCLNDKIGYTLDLVKEVLLTSDFTTKDRIKELLSIGLSRSMQGFAGRGHTIAVGRALSYISATSAIAQYSSGIDAYYCMKDLMDDYDNKFKDASAGYKDITDKLFAKENLIISYTGDKEGYEIFKKEIHNFIASLKDKSEKDPIKVEVGQKNEGFKGPYDICYNAVVGNYKNCDCGLEYSGSFLVLENAIRTDYLWKKVRVLGGAYGCMCNFDKTGNILFTSYRDPKVKETYDTYYGVTDFISEFKATDEEMTKYIIGAVGGVDTPQTPRTKGMNSLACYFAGITNDDLRKEKKEIIDCTEEDIRALKKHFECILKQNNRCTIGNEQKVEANKELFKEVKMILK